MSEFLQNRIEIIENDEAPPPNGNKFSAKYIQDPNYNWVNKFTYYNPYIGKRVVVKFGEGAIPQFDNNTLDAIAIDHYIQYNKINELSLYKSIAAIYNKLNEHKYFNTKKPNTIKNVKMHYDVANQSKVDIIAEITSDYLANQKYNPETLDKKVILHAIKRAMRQKRFPIRGGIRKTRRTRHLSRKTRTKRKNI